MDKRQVENHQYGIMYQEAPLLPSEYNPVDMMFAGLQEFKPVIAEHQFQYRAHNQMYIPTENQEVTPSNTPIIIHESYSNGSIPYEGRKYNPDKKFPCPACKSSFTRKHDRKRHMKKKHAALFALYEK